MGSSLGSTGQPAGQQEWGVRPRPAVVTRVLAELDRPGVVGVALTGPTGSGKTTLAAQVGSAAAVRAAVLLVRGATLAADLPYGALYPYLDDVADDPAGPAGATIPNPLSVIRALRRRLRELGGSTAPLVVVDNLAQVDAHSGHVLGSLAGSGALRLLVVADDLRSGPDALVDLWRDGLLGAVVVPPWDAAEVDAAVAAYLDGPVTAALRRHLHGSSAGNPMLLRHLVEHGVASGGLVRSSGVWTFDAFRWSNPEVSGLLDAPLARWTAEQRQVLELIALTDRLPLPAVSRLLSADQLEGLQRAGVVVTTAGAPPTAGIASPALARAVRQQVPWSRRRSLLELALSLGVGDGDPTADQELALAALTLDAGAVLDPALGVRAAGTALLRFDAALALRLAGAVADAAPPDAPAVAAEVVRSQALRSLGQVERSVELLERLRAGRWTSMSPGERVAWAVERAETARYAPPAEQRAALDALAAVRAAAPAEGADPEGMLDAAWAGLAFSGAHYAELAERLAPIHAAGPGAGVERWAVCGSVLAAAQAILGRQEEALAVADGVEEVWRRGELPPDLAIVAMAGLNVALLTCGRFTRVLDVIRLEGAQDPYEDPRNGSTNDLGLGLVHVLRGDGAQARPLLRAALAQAALRDPFRTEGQVRAALAWAEALAGDREAARDEIARFVPTTGVVYDGPIGAEHNLSGARLELGDDVHDEVVARGRALLELGHLGNAVVVLSQAARHGSAAAVDLLRSVPMEQPGPWMRAARDHAEGVATADAGLLVRTAEALLDEGDLGFAADVAAAAAAAPGAGREEVRAATRVLQRARRRQGAAPPPAEDRGAAPGLLTRREEEVATRAARGQSNARIAAELHLSVRTVESYLQAAFGKLGVNSRTEVAAALRRAGAAAGTDP